VGAGVHHHSAALAEPILAGEVARVDGLTGFAKQPIIEATIESLHDPDRV
jgi:hypothetical protein